MAKNDNMWLYIGIGIVIALVGAFAVTNINIPTSLLEQDPEDDRLQVKVSGVVRDVLSSTRTVVGTVVLYEPSEAGAGVVLETITITSGTWTSVLNYYELTDLYLKYNSPNGTSWFDYGFEFTIPDVASPDASQTITISEPLEIYFKGDVTDNSTNKDIAIQKDNIDVWDTYVTLGAATNAFNASADAQYTGINVRTSNEDVNTAYADPRTYYDWAEVDAYKRQKGSYLVIDFELSGASNVKSNVRDYNLKFSSAGGAEYFEVGSGMVAFLSLNDLYKCGVYWADVSGMIIGTYTGKYTIWSALFDFSGTMSSVYWDDEIDIQISIVSSYSLDYVKHSDTLTQSGADLFGELSGAWSYDCSLG